PKTAGYDEIREFHKKMAVKLAWTPGGSAMMAGRPDMARGMASVYKEMAKMDGMPLLQVMKMTPTADGQVITATSGGDAQAAQQSKPKPDNPSLSSVLGGRLGGFGGFGRKKKQTEQAKEETKETKPETSSATE